MKNNLATKIFLFTWGAVLTNLWWLSVIFGTIAESAWPLIWIPNVLLTGLTIIIIANAWKDPMNE